MQPKTQPCAPVAGPESSTSRASAARSKQWSALRNKAAPTHHQRSPAALTHFAKSSAHQIASDRTSSAPARTASPNSAGAASPAASQHELSQHNLRQSRCAHHRRSEEGPARSSQTARAAMAQSSLQREEPSKGARRSLGCASAALVDTKQPSHVEILPMAHHREKSLTTIAPHESATTPWATSFTRPGTKCQR